MKTSVVKHEILKIIGEYAITIDDGQKIYELIQASMDKKEPVELDFSGVKVVVPPFLNAAIGQLYKDYPPEEIEQLLKVENMLPLGLASLGSVKKSSYKYYTDEEYRERVEATFRRREYQ